MNIPLHRYIVKKRLILAHNKMVEGEPAGLAAAESGFNDYSGFYLQYKNMFGHVHSARIKQPLQRIP